MSRNILELKSLRVAPEKVSTLALAKRVTKLKDFDLCIPDDTRSVFR